MDISVIWGIIIDKLDFVGGLIIGLVGSIITWHQRQVELKSKLYYPLFIACYNLLFIFDEITTVKDDDEQGSELYNSALKHLDDIMNSYGTITNLKSKSKEPEKDYLNMFFKVKRIVDLNQNSINTNWSRATIWFEYGKKKQYIEGKPDYNVKIDEFNGLYTKLSKLRELCEKKDKSLKGQKL